MKIVKNLLALALFLAQGCDHPLGTKYSVARGREPTKATVELAHAAWRVAARVSSPIDAGKEMVGVAEEIGRTGDRDVLRAWIAERHESWVLSGVLAHLTVAATLDGDENQASAWFAQARDESLRTTEWRYPLIVKPLSLAEASVSLSPTQTNDAVSAINRLATWTDEKPTERIQGAAWACAYRAAADPNDAEQTVFLGAAQRFAANLLPWEHMSVLAFTAPRIRADRMRTEWLKQADARTACLTNALVAGGDFELAVRAAQVYFGLGEKSRGASLLVMAEQCDAANRTGDVCAPWVVLSDGYRAMGEWGHAKKSLLSGINRAERKSGINRDVALARTLVAMSVSGIEWKDEEIQPLLKRVL